MPFDIMGTGQDTFGAYGLVALGLAPITDAPRGAWDDRRPPAGRARSDVVPAAHG